MKTAIYRGTIAFALLIPAAFSQVVGGEMGTWTGQPVPVPGGFNQIVYVQNRTSSPINGPLVLGVHGTSPTNPVRNRSIIVNDPGEPYPVVPTAIGAGQSLQAGQTIQTVVSMTTDGGGWTIRANAGALPPTLPAIGDVNGDGISDLVVYRPATGEFVARITGSILGTNEQIVIPMGVTGTTLRPVAADYDGDGRLDGAVYDTVTSDWKIRTSSNNVQVTYRVSTGISSDTLGLAGDVLLPGDFDGDGKADPAIFAQQSGKFWYRSSRSGQNIGVALGVAGRPAPADYDGDGIMDFAVLAASPRRLIYRASSTGTTITDLLRGIPTGPGLCGGADDDQLWTGVEDMRVTDLLPARYDADGRADFAAYNRQTGRMLVRNSSNGQIVDISPATAQPGAEELTPGRYNAGIFGGVAVRMGTTVTTWGTGPGPQSALFQPGDVLNTAYRTIW